MALNTTVEETAKRHSVGIERYTGEFPSRIVDNLACLYSGLMFVNKLCWSFGQSWDSLFPIPLEACCNHLAFAAKEYLLDGGVHNQSIIEQTFEVMARMNLKLNSDYVFEAGGQQLCIWFAGVYDKYTRYRKDYAIMGEVLSAKQFYKQLEHSVYFIAKNKPKRMGDIVRKVWVVDFEKLSLVADVSGFVAVKATDSGE